MTDALVTFFTSSLTGRMGKGLICLIISLFPVLELRGGLLAASPAFLDVPITIALPLCIAGNILPIPFVLLLAERVLIWMERWSVTRPFAAWLRTRSDKHRAQIETYGFWGLVFFVGIPLPGTGAWTGSLVAALLHMSFKKALLACFLGILIAAVIMSIISYGLLGVIF